MKIQLRENENTIPLNVFEADASKKHLYCVTVKLYDKNEKYIKSYGQNSNSLDNAYSLFSQLDCFFVTNGQKCIIQLWHKIGNNIYMINNRKY